MKYSSRYILQEYANPDHLENMRSETEDTWKISFLKKDVKIELEETNSLIEEEYSLNLTSTKYFVESTTESKEAMIHHHRKGHQLRHIQFKISALRQTIRIFLDKLDESDYERCIKGFLSICHDIIISEGKEKKIKENLQKYFFNKNIKKISHERAFLLKKIKESYSSGQLTADDKKIGEEGLAEFRKEQALLPFLNW